MQREPSSENFGHLMEIIPALGMFCFCALCCSYLLVKSQMLMNTSLSKNDALLIAQSQIAILKNEETPLHGQQYYDEQLKAQSSGKYSVSWTLQEADSFLEGTMTVSERDHVLLQLPFVIDKEVSL